MPRRPRFPWPTAIVVAAAGCVSLPPAQEQPDAAIDAAGCRDDDGDGYLACGVARVDCDDGNAAIHPGALEECVGGVDEDCLEDVELRCDARLAGNDTSAAGSDPWLVTNDAMIFAFDRGPNHDGVAGAIGLRRPGGDQLMMNDPRSTERFTGVTRWQSAVSWRAVPIFDDLEQGAAVVRLRQDWTEGNVTGSATYTIYPDGRIHRHDEVTAGASSDDYLASFIVLDPFAITHAEWQGAGVAVPLDITGTQYEEHYTGAAAGTATWVCGYKPASGDRLGFAFVAPGNHEGMRVSEAIRPMVVGGVPVASFSFDWVREQTVPAGPYAADVMIALDHTTLTDPCRNYGAIAGTFTAPPNATVAAPGNVRFDDPFDGNSDGYGEAVGAYLVEVGAGARALTFSLDGNVPSLALRITGVAGAFDPVVMLDGTTLVRGRDYHLQHESDGAYWVSLAVPLPASTPLLFEWP